MLRKQKTFVSMRLHSLRKKTEKKKEEGKKDPALPKIACSKLPEFRKLCC